jgi:hypothetical protein
VLKVFGVGGEKEVNDCNGAGLMAYRRPDRLR